MKKFVQFFVLLSFTGICGRSNAQNFNLTFRFNLTYPGQSLSNLWGFVDGAGNEYALVGATNGLSIVNVTNPTAPFQVSQIAGPTCIWREIKTIGNYAYITTECGTAGLQIVNLSNLPVATFPTANWSPTILSTPLETIHALDAEGNRIYLYGSNIGVGGVVIGDVTSDPMAPTYMGNYNDTYVHDGEVRGDTCYCGHIFDGYFSVMDVSNPAAPTVLKTQMTPGAFTHNTWTSTNGNYLFTTDEISNSYLTCYDISDINNIKEMDRVQVTPGSGSIVHNTYTINVAGNDYEVASWYRDGIAIVDAGRPQNLVVVAHYDTYPTGAGFGASGAWGVYPYLPSGNILVSNIENGLWVLTPNYVRACYLEGNVTDSLCGTSLNGVTVSIISTTVSESTNLSGNYATGYHVPGTYTVTFSKPGYTAKTITGVNLSAGVVNNLNIKLYSSTVVAVNGTVADVVTSNPLAGVLVKISNATNSYYFTTNASGQFSTCNVMPGTYNVYAGGWGYQLYCGSAAISSVTTIPISLTQGYHDDFTLNYNWTVSGASANKWEIGAPVATLDGGNTANPGADVTTDCSNNAYITDNGGGVAWDHDVNGGATVVTSPAMNLAAYANPYVHYHRWFYDGGFFYGSPNDSMKIQITNGTTTATLETMVPGSPGNGTWVSKSYRVSDYVTPTTNTKIIFYTTDFPPDNIVEGGLDKFFVADSLPIGMNETPKENSMNIYPNPFNVVAQIDFSIVSDLSSGAELIVTDVMGKNIQSIPILKKSGQLIVGANLSAGIYFARIKNGTAFSRVIKLVKIN